MRICRYDPQLWPKFHVRNREKGRCFWQLYVQNTRRLSAKDNNLHHWCQHTWHCFKKETTHIMDERTRIKRHDSQRQAVYWYKHTFPYKHKQHFCPRKRIQLTNTILMCPFYLVSIFVLVKLYIVVARIKIFCIRILVHSIARRVKIRKNINTILV